MSGSLLPLDQGAGGLFAQFPDVGGGAFDDIYFDPDDTYYIGYDPTLGICGRPRQLNVTRRIDLGGTSNSYEPVLNFLSSGSCTVPVIDALLELNGYSSVNGIATPFEIWGSGPGVGVLGIPIFIHTDKSLADGARNGSVILAGYEDIALGEAQFDRIVEVGLENGAGNNIDPLMYFAGCRQLIGTGYAEVGDPVELIGFGLVPSASYHAAGITRAGLEARDDGANNPVSVTLWGKRENAAYGGAGGDAGVNAQVLADINEAAINADHVVLLLRWRDNVDAETDLFTFKDSEMEIVSAAQAAVLGTSADGAAAVGVQIGAENDFTTDGARLVEFVNNETEVRGFVDLNGDLGINMLDNGQQLTIETLTELTTIAAAATTSTAIQIPQYAVVLAVSVRVVTVIPTITDFDVGVAGAATRYGQTINPAAGTTFPGTTDAAVRYYNAATSILLTMNGGPPAAATGQVRVTIHFYRVTPPTS